MINNPFNFVSFRLIFIYTVLLGLSVSLVLMFLYFTTARDIELEADQKIIKKVEDLNNIYLRFREQGLFNYIRRETSRATLDIYRLYDSDDNYLAGNILTELEDIKNNDDGWLEFSYKVSENGKDKIFYGRGRELITPRQNFRLIVGRVVNDEKVLKERFFYSSLWSILLILFLGVFGGYFLSRNFLKRISDINRTSKKIMDGNLKERLPISRGKDELNELSSNLNDMLDRLDSLMSNMKEVTDNVAHDLRTPLNRIRTNLEITLMSNPNLEEYKKSFEEAINETDNLIKTFNSILSISKVESGASDLDKSELNLKELIINMHDLYEPITEGSGIKLNYEVTENIVIKGNYNLLSQSLANLIENAVNYGSTNIDPTINVGAKQTDDKISLWVSDNGVGINDQDKEKVVERFVRLDTSRSLKGSGLGLNLVKSAVRFHEGKFQLIDAKPSGLIVLIELPNCS
tara:strand:- start:1379 stop:2761 length:1383 start_codon:yes stop_codon:yes gene_type:complete